MAALRPWATAACLLPFALVAGCHRPEPVSTVLIVVDTLRPDHLGLYGHHRPTSPNLDRRASEAAVFDRAFATSPWTLPSFGSIFTGHYPSRHRAGTFSREQRRKGHDKDFRQLDPSLPTLAERCWGRGIGTAAIINNTFLNPRFGIDRGFESYDFMAANRHEIRRADEAVNRALEWLDEHSGQGFLLVLHLFDPHMNYDPPAAVRGKFTARLESDDRLRLTDLPEIRRRLRDGLAVDREYLEAAYDEEILFVDQQLERLFRGLERRAVLDRALVILTSDHGEEFFEHGGFEHGHTVYDELLRVPLLVWGPQVRPGRIDRPVSLVDLYPTILEWHGMEPPGDVPGLSLRPLLEARTGGEDRLLFGERTLYGPERRTAIDWPHKLTHNRATGEIALYDLAEDPGESVDVAADHPEIIERLLDAMERSLASGIDKDGPTADLDEATIDSLRSLGYVE